jgi:hypothetical protein
VPDEDVFALTAVERRRAADMFAGLSDEQWAQASLCAEWTVRDGQGPEISGPSEALALAIGGRPVALDDLAGPGLPVLRGRLS